MIKIIISPIILLVLTACSGIQLPAFKTPILAPSRPPALISPTPPFILSPTVSTPTTTLTGTFTVSPTQTDTPTITLTPTPIPIIEVDIVACDTSQDVMHLMGEVTNAYPVIRNRTNVELTNVCGLLLASDEARLHPDKSGCTAALLPGYQVVLKLTVDTGFQQDTSIQVDVTTDQGFTASVSHTSCKAIGLPGWVPLKVGIVKSIQ